MFDRRRLHWGCVPGGDRHKYVQGLVYVIVGVVLGAPTSFRKCIAEGAPTLLCLPNSLNIILPLAIFATLIRASWTVFHRAVALHGEANVSLPPANDKYSETQSFSQHFEFLVRATALQIFILPSACVSAVISKAEQHDQNPYVYDSKLLLRRRSRPIFLLTRATRIWKHSNIFGHLLLQHLNARIWLAEELQRVDYLLLVGGFRRFQGNLQEIRASQLRLYATTMGAPVPVEAFIITALGHVGHGKTSSYVRIRQFLFLFFSTKNQMISLQAHVREI
ncbi:hypothetical protein FB451DRAFT_1412622 [Mycena latifolia]|nr:hypothetical protein FB451DRAFT_1412622 [Mycena latifolia]